MKTTDMGHKLRRKKKRRLEETRGNKTDQETKAGHQLDKRSISAISDAYFDTSWRGDISWYLDYD